MSLQTFTCTLYLEMLTQVIKIWDIESGQHIGTLTGHKKAIFYLVYTADGSYLVSGSEDKTVRVWDAHTFSNCAVMPLDDGCVCISTSPESRQIFAGTLSGKLAAWRDFSSINLNVAAGLMQAHRDSTFDVHCLSNGRGIITGSRDKSVKLWSYNDVKDSGGVDGIHLPLREFLGHKVSTPVTEYWNGHMINS